MPEMAASCERERWMLRRRGEATARSLFRPPQRSPRSAFVFLRLRNTERLSALWSPPYILHRLGCVHRLAFIWGDQNYLIKIAEDTSFLKQHEKLSAAVGFTLDRNPFLTPGDTEKWREREMKASHSAPAILLAPLDKDRVRTAAKSVMTEEKLYRVTRRPLGGWVPLLLSLFIWDPLFDAILSLSLFPSSLSL